MTDLAKEWHKLLFPDATDDRFADGYTQTVTFGLLMARARDIKLSTGLDQVASPSVTVADPAVGTGTFLLGVLKRIADTVQDDEGEGNVPAAVESAINRLIAFEMQLGPFAVAQLRITGELQSLMKKPQTTALRMYVTDTLGNPFAAVEEMSALTRGISESRRMAAQST